MKEYKLNKEYLKRTQKEKHDVRMKQLKLKNGIKTINDIIYENKNEDSRNPKLKITNINDNGIRYKKITIVNGGFAAKIFLKDKFGNLRKILSGQDLIDIYKQIYKGRIAPNRKMSEGKIYYIDSTIIIIDTLSERVELMISSIYNNNLIIICNQNRTEFREAIKKFQENFNYRKVYSSRFDVLDME